LSGKIAAWLNVTPRKLGSVSRWHVSHDVEKPDEACGGEVVLL